MPTWFVTGVGALSVVLALLAGYRADWSRAREGKILIFVALFLLPVAAASLGFSRHMERAQSREFCVSCHVMTEHDRSLYLDNRSYLPAWHFQNNLVPRDKACYTCHTDYTLFGGVEAKMRGLRHLWIEYLGTVPPPEKIRVYEPYQNRECLHCHGGQRIFEEAAPHRAAPMDAILTGQRSCLVCHLRIHDVGKTADVPQWKEVR